MSIEIFTDNNISVYYRAHVGLRIQRQPDVVRMESLVLRIVQRRPIQRQDLFLDVEIVVAAVAHLIRPPPEEKPAKHSTSATTVISSASATTSAVAAAAAVGRRSVQRCGCQYQETRTPPEDAQEGREPQHPPKAVVRVPADLHHGRQHYWKQHQQQPDWWIEREFQESIVSRRLSQSAELSSPAVSVVQTENKRWKRRARGLKLMRWWCELSSARQSGRNCQLQLMPWPALVYI